MYVRVRGEPRRAETRNERASEPARRTEGETERERKKRRVTDFESAWTRLARVRGCRHGGRGRKGGGERERHALEGERGGGRSENESVRIYVRARARACVYVCVRWEVSSERRGRGKKKRSRYTRGTFGGEGINACQRRGREKDGAEEEERKGSERAGGREESTKRVYGRRINRRERRYRRRIVRLLGQVVWILIVTHATDRSTRALTRFPPSVGTTTPGVTDTHQLALVRSHSLTRMHMHTPLPRDTTTHPSSLVHPREQRT